MGRGDEGTACPQKGKELAGWVGNEATEPEEGKQKWKRTRNKKRAGLSCSDQPNGSLGRPGSGETKPDVCFLF
jgi:hypothetical protein